MKKFKNLLGTRLLIKQLRIKKVGTIIFAAEDQQKNKEAEVLQIGNDVPDIEVGDKILIDEFSENVLEETSEGEIYSIIDYENVIGVLA